VEPPKPSRQFLKAFNLSASLGLKTRILGLVISILSTPIILSQVGNEDYAKIVLLSAVVAFIQILDLGIPHVAANNYGEYKAINDLKALSIFYNNLKALLKYATLTVCFLAAIIFVIFTYVFESVSNFPGNFGVSFYLIASFIALMMMCSNMTIRYLQAQQRFLLLARLNISGIFAGNALAITFAFAGFSIYLISFVAVAIPSLPSFLFAIKLYVSFSRQNKVALTERLSFRKTFAISHPYILTNISNSLFSNFDTVMISIYLNFYSVTEYGIVNKFFLLFYNLYIASFHGVYSFFVASFSSNRIEELKNNYEHVQKTASRLGILTGGSFAICGGSLIEFWTGGEVQPNIVLIFTMSLWTFLCVTGYPSVILFLVTSSSREKVLVQASSILTNSVLSFIFMNLFPSTSSALLASIVSTILCIYLPIHFLRNKLWIKRAND
jgi:O-antigen/teichoic acid export membrane protein